MSNQIDLFVKNNNLILTCIETLENINLDTQNNLINKILSELDQLIYKCSYLTYYEICDTTYTFFEESLECLQFYNINSNNIQFFCEDTLEMIIKLDQYNAVSYIYDQLEHFRKILTVI